MVGDLGSGLVLVAVTAWQQVLQLGPFVGVGILLAALLNQFDLPRRWSQVWSKRGWLQRGSPASVLVAACLGGLSPLSTYGTVPILLQLVRNGASLGPVLAFLAASSMLNPQLFFLVLGALGARVALAQVAGILGLALILGVATARLRPELLLRADLVSPPTLLRTSLPKTASSRFFGDVLAMVEWIALTFVVGVTLGSALQVFIPAEAASALLGSSPGFEAVGAAVLGIPLYTCGGSAVPVLAGLGQMGLSRAAALAFLLSGPATRVTALAAMGSLLNRRALGVYIVYIVAGAVVAGLLLGSV